MRMGKVKFNVSLEYAVDMDNEAMVKKAKAWLEQDVYNLIEDDDVYSMIAVEPIPGLTVCDIHSGLMSCDGE